MNINIFSFPAHSQRCDITIKYIKELIIILNSKYGIQLRAEAKDGHIAHRSFSRFLMEFLRHCKENKKPIDIHWLAYLNRIIKVPSPNILLTIKLLARSDFKFLEPFLLKAQSNARNWASATGAQFIALENLRLKKGQGPWGANLGRHPNCVAIETTGYKESIFHEFLHQFGVTEGYDKKTKSTLRGCERCWMQWNAIKGNGLCERHQEELKSFINAQVDEALCEYN